MHKEYKVILAKRVNISRILGDNTKYIPFKRFPTGKKKIVPFSNSPVQSFMKVL
jgi:hypothetical protein